MKVRQCVREPRLWYWLRTRLPPGLRYLNMAKECAPTSAIEIRHGPLWCWWFGEERKVAYAAGDTLVVYRNEWLGELTELVRRYEAETGQEIEVTVWVDPPPRQ